MSGNLIQVGSDNKLRIKNDSSGRAGIVVAGPGDPCCCCPSPPEHIYFRVNTDVQICPDCGYFPASNRAIKLDITIDSTWTNISTSYSTNTTNATLDCVGSGCLKTLYSYANTIIASTYGISGLIRLYLSGYPYLCNESYLIDALSPRILPAISLSPVCISGNLMWSIGRASIYVKHQTIDGGGTIFDYIPSVSGSIAWDGISEIDIPNSYQSTSPYSNRKCASGLENTVWGQNGTITISNQPFLVSP